MLTLELSEWRAWFQMASESFVHAFENVIDVTNVDVNTHVDTLELQEAQVIPHFHQDVPGRLDVLGSQEAIV